MLFQEIPGNLKVKKNLINTAKNKKVAHAQFFFGKQGGAQLVLALAYAQFLNCETPNIKDSCNTCSSCLKYNNISHPDLHCVFPTLKTKNSTSDDFMSEWRVFVKQNEYGSLNDWLDLIDVGKKSTKKGVIYKDEINNIHNKIRLKNYEGKYRVILIWMPERMNVEASNKILKTLEEPPSRTLFFLVGIQADGLIPTVLSRLQTTRVPSFNTNDIVSYFGEKKISFNQAKQLNHLTEGDLGEIKKLINGNNQDFRFFDCFSFWMRILYKTDIQKISDWANKMTQKGRKNQEMFLSYSLKMIRNCLIYNFADQNLLTTNDEEYSFLINFSPFINEKNSGLIVEKIESSIREFNRNANTKILFFELSLQIARFLKLKRSFAIK